MTIPSTSPLAVPFRIAGAVVLAVLLVLSAVPAAFADAAGARWVQQFWPTAQKAGISRSVYMNALGNFTPDPDVLAKARTQAEFVKPVWDYLDGAVSEKRMENGKAALRQYGPQLARIEAAYGVDRSVVVAIWGMESSYGAVLQNEKIVKSTIRSLATLAYQGGSRAKYGRTQLIAALKILQRGDISARGMTGSWAGAMGHTQFIPTTYQAYAVDFDGDGHRDIWNSEVDALASTANYLSRMGWRLGEPWGYEVVVPRGFDWRLADQGKTAPLSAWKKAGLKRVAGRQFPDSDVAARLYAPAGANGPAFLLLPNFKVIKRYNNADAYALGVGHLSDRLRGSGDFVAEWPREVRPLTADERAELQSLLTRLGLYDGSIDGKLGAGTREAIRTYQRQAGQVPDGYASSGLLQALRAGG
ncbi:lytic murein transglycosylase [Kaistia geumhonensis]|uniref:Membrane-bound lytic murein transglycosylase B n=1 Tax=Kaistia geumhonensis TaxID=410839 RepID=A0ABU0M987_9HYPH|nr:lytic murein transglycosylase [Kaistia geumhonensis]MCX5480770.1 lytic murein transglycosylase [Kaistia geumhonensis]MDQ0517526.1 membrane-bound lytic murein transglycosylase B [Kaistia geumhonensis]